MALDHPSFARITADTLKKRLPAFRNILINNFGEHLDYSMMTAEKNWSTEEKERTLPNTTVVLMQISNDKEFGVLKVLFDDTSKKIILIETLNVKEPIPSMTRFWLIGLIAICIPIFNIYVIRQIKRSDLKKKWLKYIAVMFLNVPSITYSAVNGLSIGMLDFQFLFGISFEISGYLNSSWVVGLPLGGFYWLYKLRQKNKLQLETNLKSETPIDVIDNKKEESTGDNMG